MPTVQDDEVVCELFTIDIRKSAADGQTCYFFFFKQTVFIFSIMYDGILFVFFLTVPSCFYSHLASIS